MSATVSKAVGDAATSDPEEPRRERALVVVREGGQAAPDGEKYVLHGVTGFLRRVKPYQRVPVETVVIAIEQLTERLDVSPPRPIEDVSPRRSDCDRLGLLGLGCLDLILILVLPLVVLVLTLIVCVLDLIVRVFALLVGVLALLV